MVETNVTRRRVLRGTGAIGIATLGTTTISAQEGDGGQDGQGPALRVAHASPDAPNVDVRLNSMDAGGTTTDGNETGGDDTDGGDADVAFTGIGFGDVSEYNDVDPGTYQVQIVPSEGLIGEFVEDLFGSDDEVETILLDDQIGVGTGDSLTVVAFGEAARGPVPTEDAEMPANETDGVGTGGTNETDGMGTDGTTGDQLIDELGFGEAESVEVPAESFTLEISETGAAEMSGDGTDGVGTGGNETDGGGAGGDDTDGGGADESGGMSASARGFQVAVLEDDVTDPGDDTARLRVFQAVPDVDAVSISKVTAAETPTGDGVGANETEDGADGNESDGVSADGGVEQRPGVRRRNLPIEGNTVYAGFAMGYFNPQAAATPDGGDDNATDGGMTGGDNATGDGNETSDGEAVPEDGEGEEFQFVLAETAQGGERSDGGTGGLL